MSENFYYRYLFFLLLSFLAHQYNRWTLPEANPFELITVSFEGLNGEGQAEIRDVKSKNDIDPNLIDYEISPKSSLSEGQNVTVSAKSEKYRLNPNEKQYQVSGLDLYLDDVNKLSSKQLDLLHSSSLSVLDESIGSKSHLDEISNEYVTSYFFTNHKKNNILVDVYKYSFVNYEHNLTSELYLACYYQNLILRGPNYQSMDYDYKMYSGDSMPIFSGDYWSPYITAFHSLEEVKAYFLTQQKVDMEFQERKAE